MASRWNGKIKFSAFYARKLHKTRENLDLVIYVEMGDRNSRSHPRTFVVAGIDVPDSYRMQIYRNVQTFRKGAIFGSGMRTDFRKRISTNNPELDESFFIEGAGEPVVRSLLTDKI